MCAKEHGFLCVHAHVGTHTLHSASHSLTTRSLLQDYRPPVSLIQRELLLNVLLTEHCRG